MSDNKSPDEGPLAAACYIENGHIVINFYKNVEWLSLHAPDARAMAHTLLDKADELDRQQKGKR